MSFSRRRRSCSTPLKKAHEHRRSREESALLRAVFARGGWNNAVKLDGSEMAPYRMLKKNQGISVGTNGRRYYMDWDGSTMYKDWAGTDLSLNYGCRHGHQNFGGDWASLPQPSVSWFVFDSNGLAKNAYLGKYASTNTLMTQTQTTQDKFDVDPAEDGYGYKADTIEDLAAGSGYGPDGEGYVRISLTTPDDRLVEAVDRIRETM